METARWQVVEFDLSPLCLGEPLEAIGFNGDLEGTFYVDDLRLVAADAPPPATAVVERRQDATPEDFELRPGYPNPFNSATVIPVALRARAQIDLAVFDLLGQRVATLAQGSRPAGLYTLTWDGRDNAGRALASGTYLVHLRAGEARQTRKLMLLR